MRVNDRYLSFYYENDNDIGEVTIEKKKTALLIIDMQHVFLTCPALAGLTEKEREDIKRWMPFYQAVKERVIPNNERILNIFRDKGMEVCFAKIQGQKKNGLDRSLVQKATGYNQLLLLQGDKAADICCGQAFL